MVKVNLVVLGLSTILPGAFAWGSLGHTTIAYIASSFVDPKTAIYFQSILGDKSTDYLAKVATWYVSDSMDRPDD